MRILTTTFLSLVILGAGVGGYLLFGKPPQVVQSEAKTDTGPLVKTTAITSHNQPVVVEMDGEANSHRVIAVAAQVRGQIEQRSPKARSGMFVCEGDVLYEIDDTNYRLELERLEAQLIQTDEETVSVEVDITNTGALIALAEQDARLQKKHLDRMNDALARKSASESDVDAALRQEITARNALQTLLNTKRSREQMLKQMAATRMLVTVQIKQAHVNLERCRVHAPVTGRIVDDIAEQGDYIQDGDELVHISDSSQIEVKCSLQADDLVWVLRMASESAVSAEAMQANPLATPIPCEVVYDFGGIEVQWNGVLSRFEGTGIDRETRTFPCRVTVAEPNNYCIKDGRDAQMIVPPGLAAGMFVTVRIPITASGDLLHVPARAVRPGGDVLVVRDGILHVHRVNIARSTDEYALIHAEETGPVDGDQVIVSPMVSVKDGMHVRREDDE